MAYHQGLFGYTPIHEAVSNGHSKVLQLLLEHEGDPNCRANSGYTPLHLAACSGNVDCVWVLLDYNADITSKDVHGNTPLQTAELSSKYNVTKALRSAGKCISYICNNTVVTGAIEYDNVYLHGYIRDYNKI